MRVSPRSARARVSAILGADAASVVQGLAALLVSSGGDLLAGLTLGAITHTLEDLPGLLVLVPAAIGMRGNIYRSADQGSTWQKIELGTTTSIMSGHVLADGRVLLVGNTGLLAVSGDGGQSFELHSSGRGRGFAAFVEVDGHIILAGEGGITPLDPAWLGQ